MKSTAQRPAMPREVEALRTSLESQLSALEKALADPRQHGSLESIILDLARIATEEAHETARHAVLDVQKAAQEAVAAARTDATAALEAEKVETAALRQVIESARSALQQAETMLKDQRRAADAASQEAVSARRELETIRERLEQEQSAGADRRGELEAALETERAAAAELLQARSALEGRLDAAGRELETARSDRDGIQRELDAVRRELDGVLQDSHARTQVLSESQAAQEQALKTAHDVARNAEARLEEVIRERDAALKERVELQRQLESAEAAIREAAEINRELQAAHEARDAAEVLEAAREPERAPESEVDVETVVDLTSITRDEERQLVLEQRTRVLEQALRDAEARAESAELELERHRLSLTPSLVASHGSAPAAAPQTHTVPEPSEQFRGPSRGARRVAFKAEIPLQVDGNPGKLVDLSLTGAQVLTPSAINPNRLVTVTLPISDGALACKAKVVWSRLEPRAGQLWYRAGVQFTNVDQRALEMFFSAHQS